MKKNLKKWLVVLMMAVLVITMTACSGGNKDAAPAEKKEETAAAPAEEKKEETAAAPAEEKKEETAAAPAEEKKEEPAAAPAAATGNPLVDNYGFQWQDASAPILNEQGAKDIAFRVYSSKNASAKDYNDMKIMADLFAQTNVQVNWENVSESVYSQQKNLIFGNKDNRPDAIYHAGMGAGEIICRISPNCWRSGLTSGTSC